MSIVIHCQPFPTSIVIIHLLFHINYYHILTISLRLPSRTLYFPTHLQLSLIYISLCLLFTFLYQSRSTIILQLVRANHPEAHSSRRFYAAVNAESVRLSLLFPPVYPSKPCLQRLCRFEPFTAVFRRYSFAMCIYTFYTIILFKSSLFLLWLIYPHSDALISPDKLPISP